MLVKLKVGVAAIAAAVLAAGCGSSSMYKQATGSGDHWDGLGAKLAVFQAAHPGCPAQRNQVGWCAGPVVNTPNPPLSTGKHQFFALLPIRDNTKVIGLSESFPAGTSVRQAMTDIRALLPTDVSSDGSLKTITIGHSSCAYYNLKGPEVATILSDAGDSDGAVGVELDSYGAGRLSKWDPKSVTSAQLWSFALNPTTVNCHG